MALIALFEVFRGNGEISVKFNQIVPLRTLDEREAGIERVPDAPAVGTEPPILSVHDRYPGMSRREPVKHCICPVSRAVVNDDPIKWPLNSDGKPPPMIFRCTLLRRELR